MNKYMDRQLVSQFVITLGVCVFGWIMIVQPMSNELADLNKKLAEAKSHPMQLDHASIETMADKMDSVRKQVMQVQSKNWFAADTSRRYSLIMNLASEHRVVVHRLDPGTAGKSKKENDNVLTARFDMSVEGKYENLSKFLDAINSIEGFVEPLALAISPKGYQNHELVDARITCQALAFSLPDQLASMAGGQASE